MLKIGLVSISEINQHFSSISSFSATACHWFRAPSFSRRVI